MRARPAGTARTQTRTRLLPQTLLAQKSRSHSSPPSSWLSRLGWLKPQQPAKVSDAIDVARATPLIHGGHAVLVRGVAALMAGVIAELFGLLLLQ